MCGILVTRASTGPEIITSHGLREIENSVIEVRFVHTLKASERNFFHSISRNPWEVIISGPVLLLLFILGPSSCVVTRDLDRHRGLINIIIRLRMGGGNIS